ncbi:hypothetical protein HY612_00910 [Candidatus Roizmanbacteria bacterium]|nr:hypothetical protein [Candidatus Roizmanbacteria bacterium]
MNKYLIFILFILAFLSITTSIQAFDPFIKSPSNPLPFTNNFQNWNEVGQYQPSVIFDNGIYKMWYASNSGSQFKIIYAVSPNAINWARQNLLDLYPGFDNHDPAILKTQNGFTLFFVASTNRGSQNFKIYKIDSPDGINFDTNSRLLVLQPSNNLETNAVSSPFVIYENATYYLFYLCWGSQGFRICLTTSTDGNQWQRCQNNPIISEISDGPTILTKEGKHYLFFQSPLGVRQAESSDNLSCSMTWSNFQTVLQEAIIGPSILENQNILYLYYSGFEQPGLTINLATSGVQVSPTPTITPSPTLTQTPTPTPTPKSIKNKIVLIPGLFASWNKDAMLHNTEVSQDKWKLLAFVKEYNGLTKSLQNLGYIKDKDFFIFAYDWRKNLDVLADDLKQFLTNQKLANSPIDLVGHSLGGLVTRIYGQKNGISSIDKIITVGSPHLGTAKVYRLVEAGEIEREDSTLWLMQKLFFSINRKMFETDKQTIQNIMPVANDLFPIYDFLLDNDGNTISIQSMKIKNMTLLSYTSSFPQLFTSLTTIAGNKDNNTLSGYKVVQRTKLDVLLNNYPDGRPSDKRFANGDGVINTSSALAGNEQIGLLADHGEIIYKSQSIKTILDKLNIPYSQNQIIEGDATKISPSLIFSLLSPAEMEVEFNSQQYKETEGLIYIENAQRGDYTLKVQGRSPGGSYSVLVGQISDNDDEWFEIKGEINKLFPFLQTDTYHLSFNPDNLLDFPVNQNDIISLFDLLIQRLSLSKKDYRHSNLGEAIEEVKEAKKSFSKKKFDDMRKELLESHEEIFEARRKGSTIFKNELYDAVFQLENLYERTSQVSNYSPNQVKLQKKLNDIKEDYLELEEYLLKQKNKGKNVMDKSVSLSQMIDKLQKAQEEISKNNLPLVEILLISAERLGKEVK